MRTYLAAVQWCLRFRKTVVLGVIVFIIASLAICPKVLCQPLIPAKPKFSLELQASSTLQQTKDIAARAQKLLIQMPDVTQVFTALGISTSGGNEPSANNSSNDVRKDALTLALKIAPSFPANRQRLRMIFALNWQICLAEVF